MAVVVIIRDEIIKNRPYREFRIVEFQVPPEKIKQVIPLLEQCGIPSKSPHVHFGYYCDISTGHFIVHLPIRRKFRIDNALIRIEKRLQVKTGLEIYRDIKQGALPDVVRP